MKGALKAKSIFMVESCDFNCMYESEEYLNKILLASFQRLLNKNKFYRNIMIFIRLLHFKKMVTHPQNIFIGFIKNF